MLYLVPPTFQIIEQLQGFKAAFAFIGQEIHGASGLMKSANAEQYLFTRPWLAKDNHMQFYAVDPNVPLLVGCLRISPVLTQELLDDGSCNIGYSVHPMLWNQGYGTKLLRQAYLTCYSLGLSEVWLAARNPASQRAILKSGAQLMIQDGCRCIFCKNLIE